MSALLAVHEQLELHVVVPTAVALGSLTAAGVWWRRRRRESPAIRRRTDVDGSDFRSVRRRL